ncbi:MAG: trypsin-like peptidase domain-containing protein, partial [Psychroserpens sp.]|nr:trypsin-like peptidase domain-containing protein [Psychroserpens sp.]
MIDKKFSRYERITNTPDLLSEIKRKSKDKDAVERVKTKAIIGDGPTKFDPDGFNKKLDDHNFDFGPVEEAIIEVFGRPVLEIENDNINTDEPELDFWKSILDDNNDGFHEVIKSVGRIEVNGHPNLDWVGTGWLYKDDYIITNRHVAKEFARKRGSEFVFKKTFWGDQYECKIDFKEEIGSSKSVEYALHKVVYIAPENGPDVAVLKIKWTDNNSKFASLILADEIIKDETIAIIGYPARDSRTNIPEDQLRIFSNVFNKKRLAVGEIDYIDKHLQFFVHDCTTLGGNSGSPVIDIESKKVYGLHFSGREREGNFAVTSVLLEQLLNDVTKKTMVSTGTTISEDFADLEKRISKEDLKDRNGYNKDFLNKTIPFPELSDTLQDEVATFGENHDETELKYTNYSVIMSA